MSLRNLMSWTRLDDDRTNHAATVSRLKGLGVLADLGAQGQVFVRREQRDHIVVEGGEHHALGDHAGDRFGLKVHNSNDSLSQQFLLGVDLFDAPYKLNYHPVAKV